MIRLAVDKNYAGARLDRFLKEKLGMTHGNICKITRSGLVKIDGKKVKFDHRLTQDSTIELMVNPDAKSSENTDPKPNISLHLQRIVEKNILYEDENLLVIDKPYGISVQKTDPDSVSLIDILHQIRGVECRVVHRLDKNTTGVMLFAKNKHSARDLAYLFEAKSVKKYYLAILEGKPQKECGTVEIKMSKTYNNSSKEAKMTESSDGQNSVSEYKIMDNKGGFCVAEFMPITGKMHQIRMHAKKLGCPILGDEKYNLNYQKTQKLHLVSYKISMPGKSFRLTKLPQHFSETMQNLQLNLPILAPN